MSDRGETSPGSCTHDEGEERMVWGGEGEAGWLGGVNGVDRSTWEAECRDKIICRNIW